MRNTKQTYPHYNSDDGKAIITLLNDMGFPQYRIAALFDVNQGRVNEVIKGKHGYKFQNRQS